MLLLDFIRYHQHLTGTKIGCREGDCGACTVLVGKFTQNHLLEYESMTSCLMPLGNAHGKHIITIEGINFPDKLNCVQEAMADAGATQCGFCTPGFVMSLTGFCLSGKEHSEKNAIASIDGNICRCTGYKSIERAATAISDLMQSGKEKNLFPEYLKTIAERLKILNSSDSRPPTTDYRLPLSGGTDLYVQKHDELTHAEIEFLFDRHKEISRDGDVCRLGAGVTVSQLKNDPLINELFPSFQSYAKLVSSTPIRNMATIAGNFVNASPIGDFTILFLALDAQLVLGNGNSIRELPLRKFYKGYKQLDKLPEERIQSIWFKIPASGFKFNFEKVSKRTHLDIASVNTAICLDMDGQTIKKAGIAAGGVGPVPLFLPDSSAFLEGKKLSLDLAQKIIPIAKKEISPISDAKGSKEYKSLLLGQLIKAHFNVLN